MTQVTQLFLLGYWGKGLVRKYAFLCVLGFGHTGSYVCGAICCKSFEARFEIFIPGFEIFEARLQIFNPRLKFSKPASKSATDL